MMIMHKHSTLEFAITSSYLEKMQNCSPSLFRFSMRGCEVNHMPNIKSLGTRERDDINIEDDFYPHPTCIAKEGGNSIQKHTTQPFD